MPRLLDLLTRARARSREIGRPVLASYSDLVIPVDPLDILGHEAPQVYWAAPDRSLVMAGIGAATVVQAAGPRRFSDAAGAVRELLDDAMVEPSLYRPVVVGGFAFEDEGPRTSLWAGFPSASLVVPKLLARRRGDDCVLTASALVDAHAAVEQIADELRALLSRARTTRTAPPPSFNVQTTVTGSPAPEEWRALVERAVAAIRNEEMEKVVVARSEHAPIPEMDLLAALRHLRDANRGAFIYAFWQDDAVFLGASPELLARVNGRDVCTSVLAGSAGRGESSAEDASLAGSLVGSTKNREEHTIVRREIEASLAMVCDHVHGDARPELVTLPNVHHLHTAIRARLRDGRTVFDVLERLHPTPAVGGSPRAAALTFIRRYEGLDRGWYAAPVGWTDGTQAEFAVALRCALFRRDAAHFFAGCGIVEQSDADAEWEESQLKLRPALEALSVGVVEAQESAGGAR